MTKLLIDVHTPGNGKTYEFQIDGATAAGPVAEQMIAMILEAENGAIAIDPRTAILSDATAGIRLDRGAALFAAGVRSGHRLILA